MAFLFFLGGSCLVNFTLEVLQMVIICVLFCGDCLKQNPRGFPQDLNPTKIEGMVMVT